MNSKIVVAVIIGVAAAASLYLFVSDGAPDPKKITSNLGESGLGLSYVQTNSELRQILKDGGILMSSPVTLSEPRDIRTYCTFFEGSAQQIIEYCASTELKDEDGAFLGNIHMVGSREQPKVLLGLVQIDPYLYREQSAKEVFSVMINHVICDCWSSDAAGVALESVADEHLEFHISGGQITSKSSIIPLEERMVQFEITTNTEGYLWKMLIT